LNRFIVFFTTGLWHGAAFNFIFWGLAHGALMIFERALPKTKKVFFSLIQRILTLFAVIFLWVLFRNGTADTIKIILKLFGINYSTFTGEIRNIQQDEILTFYIDCKFLILLAIGILLSFPWWRKIRLFYSNNKYISIFLTGLKYLILITLLILCYASLAANSYNPFIYFRF
jgi:alginate O-acetyltransferase complex protein AlgI